MEINKNLFLCRPTVVWSSKPRGPPRVNTELSSGPPWELGPGNFFLPLPPLDGPDKTTWIAVYSDKTVNMANNWTAGAPFVDNQCFWTGTIKVIGCPQWRSRRNCPSCKCNTMAVACSETVISTIIWFRPPSGPENPMGMLNVLMTFIPG